jgi:PelA/Pel-15E family pectate lyase
MHGHERTDVQSKPPRLRGVSVAAALVIVTLANPVAAGPDPPDRRQVLATMKRATTFMVDKVSTNGGYVWNYLPDLSRRWGEMEARDTMIWIQPPGTATMGHLFLDAYHATGDEYYYQAAGKVAGALIRAQLPEGGWNYVTDFAGDRSLREWYDTVGKNAWRLEEFQHYWGNATFDDAGTAESSKLLLRMYLEKRDPTFKPALDRAIRFVIESQYPIGAWPQRFPLKSEFSHHGKPDYTSFLTFNDDVAAENIDFMIMCYQTLGDERLLDPMIRGMNAFIVTQMGPPHPGWALQYTRDLQPSGARTYEPNALVTHTTATNLELLMKFYRLTGQTKFLARLPEAIDWLEGLTLPPAVAPAGRTHPTFVELGTNKPLYVHREGSNVVNGRYYVDYSPKNTIGHYSAFRHVDIAGLRKRYREAKAMSPAELKKRSPLESGGGAVPLSKFFVADGALVGGLGTTTPQQSIAALNADGYWPGPLGYNSHQHTRDGSMTVTPGDFSETHVGDETDTSPYRDEKLIGISTAEYIRNMGILMRAVQGGR